MKKILFLLTVVTTISFSQSADTLTTASSDSIDIRALVLKQINDARQKQYEAILNPVPFVKENIISINPVEEKLSVPLNSKAEDEIEAGNSFYKSFLKIPVYYQIFSAVSFVILAFISIRRLVLGLNKRSTKALKKKIGMLREEKVGGAKVNPRVQKARRFLKDNLEVFKQNDKNLSKNARQLNIAKGELLLAARLKLLEVGKM